MLHLIDGDISGNPNLEITGVSEIQNGFSGTISFLGNQAYRKYMDSTKASAVIVSDKKYLSGKGWYHCKKSSISNGKSFIYVFS